MPPPEFGARLSEADIQLIERWIREGAELEQHWSFTPPIRPVLPEVKLPATKPQLDIAWTQHPVDRFVLSKQLSLGMQPSQPASKAELLRRLSLNLTGLPPTPEQIWRDLKAIIRSLPMKTKWIDYSLLQLMANTGHQMVRLRAGYCRFGRLRRRSRRERSGPIAIGWSMQLMKTCPSINSRSSSWLETCFQMPRNRSW